MHLFNAICIVEDKPNRTSQDICLRLLWMEEKERYSFGVSFHEVNKLQQQSNGQIKWRPPRRRAPQTAPSAYLGKSESNIYDPVCICWTGVSEWSENCGALWYSAESLGLKTAELALPNTVHQHASYVPIEDVLVRFKKKIHCICIYIQIIMFTLIIMFTSCVWLKCACFASSFYVF
jgi:hypothetical protein